MAPAQLAGWWTRAGAAVIDALIVSVPATLLAVWIVVTVTGPLGGVTVTDHDTGMLIGFLTVIVSMLLVTLAVLLTAFLYAPLTMRREGPHNGQTWGKQLVGIRVVRLSGEPHTFGSAVLREPVVKLLLIGVGGGFLASVPTLLNYLWPLWDDESRALHDMLVDTRVVYA